jgi:signal transduction histidine kinase
MPSALIMPADRPSFIQRVLAVSDHLPSWLVAMILMVFCALIGWLDAVSGWEWSVFLLYAVPITLAVWWGGRNVGIILSVICGIIWWVGHEEHHPYSSNLSYYLAAISRVVYFVVAAIGASAVKAKQEADSARILALEEMRQLEKEIINISEYEQQRIGQDLHDGICQQLAAIGCAVRALADDLHARELPEAADAVSIESAIQNAVIEARSLARGIFPVHVDRTGLSTALNELAETTSRMTGIPIDVAEWSEVHLNDPDVAMHLYRIAQEAVNNAVKHSGAGEIAITLRAMGDLLELRIEDDGKGIPWRKGEKGGGLGMRTMRYRAQAIGGEIEIEPRPDHGTAVTCLLKVRTKHETNPRLA